MRNSRASAVIFVLFAVSSACGISVYQLTLRSNRKICSPNTLRQLGRRKRGHPHGHVWCRAELCIEFWWAAADGPKARPELSGRRAKASFQVKLPGTDYIVETFVCERNDVRVAFSQL